MNRYKASAYHFVGSAAVLFLVFAWVRWVWYPGAFFTAARGINLLGIIVPVDVIIGPLITLIIFNPVKQAALKRDMAIIFIAQVVFLLYGIFTLYSARPVYVALVEKDFYLVTANEIEPQDQQKAKDPQFQKQPLFGPQWVSTAVTDAKVREDLAFNNALTRLGQQNLPEYFKSYDSALSEVKAAALASSKLVELNLERREALQKYVDQKKKENTSVGFIRLYTKTKIIYVAINLSTGGVLDMF